MYALWLASEDSALPATLAVHLRALGTIFAGTTEASQFKEADPPDLVVVAAIETAEPGARTLERLLGFLRSIPHPGHAPAPVLFLEPPTGRFPTHELRALVDDRPLSVLPWPLEPDTLVEAASRALGRSEAPASLRERARREWVSERVELLYADLELPELRQAIDPKNAARPVLLRGEPGTRRGLVARYIHNLAEPPRQRLITLAFSRGQALDVEQVLLERSAGLRTTVFLQHLDRADPGVQEDLAQLLSESGVLGVESIRWIASVTRARSLVPALRLLPWLGVDLPPLRARKDLLQLARALGDEWCRSNRRAHTLGNDALDSLSAYLWPGNLRELEAVLSASLQRSPAAELAAHDLCFDPDEPPAPMAPPGAPSAGPPAGVRLEAEDTPLLEDLPALEEDDTPTEIEPERPRPAPDAELMEQTFEDDGAAAEEAADPPAPGIDVRELIAPLVDEIRQPLRAIRTYANLLEQRPDDSSVRRDLQSLVEGDIGRVEETLHRLERFAGFGPPRLEPVDLPAVVAAELQERQATARERGLVVLRELDQQAPPARADERQIRFAIGALLDRALRMIPRGGDLYVGSLHRPGREGEPAGHRLLLRFHSPEEVLVGPSDLPGSGAPVEIVLARELVERMGGVFAVDASGSQDNVILIELPA